MTSCHCVTSPMTSRRIQRLRDAGDGGAWRASFCRARWVPWWRESPSSPSCVCSGTRSWLDARWGRARPTVRRDADATDSGCSGIPSPVRASGGECTSADLAAAETNLVLYKRAHIRKIVAALRKQGARRRAVAPSIKLLGEQVIHPDPLFFL